MQMQNTQLCIEIINYANKRYNAGLTIDCAVIEADEYAFVGLTKKQANAVEKSMKTIMRKNAYSLTQDDANVYSNALETAIEVKQAQQELQQFNITLQ
jgi:hypothetical protein